MMCDYCKFHKTSFSNNLMSAKKKYKILWADANIVKAIKDCDENGYSLKKEHYYLAISADDYGFNEISFCPNCGRKLDD